LPFWGKKYIWFWLGKHSFFWGGKHFWGIRTSFLGRKTQTVGGTHPVVVRKRQLFGRKPIIFCWETIMLVVDNSNSLGKNIISATSRTIFWENINRIIKNLLRELLLLYFFWGLMIGYSQVLHFAGVNQQTSNIIQYLFGW